MKLLVDENLSVHVARRLTVAGLDAIHVTDLGLANTDDGEILHHALSEGMVIVTADTDFGALLAVSESTAPSVVLFRSADHLKPDEQADLLGRALPYVKGDVEQGAVVSLSPDQIRIRALPIGREPIE